jgi:hypothetical protein
MTRRTLVICTALLMSSGLTAVAQQQTAGVSLTDRVRGAGRVVVATATSVTPSWRTNAYGDRLIVSRVALQVEETMKGSPAGTVFVDIEGGTLDNFTLSVSSQTPVNVGDRAVFLLDDTSTGVTVPHLKGLGVLKLDSNNQIQTLGNMRLDDVRRTTLALSRPAVK